MATLPALGKKLVETRLRFNFRFLARLAVALALFVGIAYGLHRYQSRKLVAAYHDQAERARADDKPRLELDYLRKYLLANPDDAAARARSGMLMARLATRPQERLDAYFALQDALRRDPNLPIETRVQSAKLALDPAVGLPVDARRDLELLRNTDPTNVEYGELFADSYLLTRDFSTADTILTEVIAQDKARVSAYAKKAWVRRVGLSKPDTATEVVEAMLFANPQSTDALVTAAEHWRAVGQADRYRQAVERARQIAPDDPRVVFAYADLTLNSAEEMRRRGDKTGRDAALVEVIGLFTKLINELAPKLPAADTPPEAGSDAAEAVTASALAYHKLVAVLAAMNKLDTAQEWADKAVEAFPGSPTARLDRVDLLVTRLKLDEADAAIAELQQLGTAPGLIDLHRGRILAQRGQWPAACRALETASLALVNDPGLARKANLLLALCYRETGELDRRYEAFRRATPDDLSDPDWIPAIAGIAETLQRLGRATQAMTEFRRLARVSDAAYAPLVRLGIEEELGRPSGADGKPDWSRVEADLARVPPGPDAEVLTAELLALKSQLAAARERLAKATIANPNSIQIWSMRVLLELANNQTGRAAEVLKEAQARFPISSELSLLALRLHMAGPATAAGIEEIVAAAETLPPADRRAVLATAAMAAQLPKVNRRDLARKWLDRATTERPSDLDLQFARFDAALLDKDRVVVDEVLKQIAVITGGDDTVPSKVARAFALLDTASPGDPSLTTVSDLLEGLERQRGGWGRLYLAQGRTADLQGNAAKAAEKYQLAVDAGERAPVIVGRLLDLYYQTERYAEADRLLRTVPAAANAGSGGEAMLVELMLGAKNYNRAVEIARKAVPLDSTNPDRLAWRARVEAVAGRPDEALTAARRVTELAPTRPQGWVALVQLIAASRRPQAELDAAIAAAEKAIPAADALLALAQCYEIAKRFDQAQAKYDALTAPADASAAALRAAITFDIRQGQLAKARPLIDRLLALTTKTPEDETFARRLLALILSEDRRPEVAASALSVLGLTSVDEAAAVTKTDRVEDIRTRAVVVARLRGRRPRQAAVRLLEQLEERAPLTADDQFLLGQLYEALGDWPRAKSRLGLVAGLPNAELRAVTAYAFALLRHGEANAAQQEIVRVERSAPGDPALAELRARLAIANQKPDEAVAIAKTAGETQKRPELSAALLERVGLPKLAEPFYRAAATDPAGRVGLASYLARRDRLADAWTVFESVWGQIPSQVMVPTVCEAALQAGANSPDVLKRVRDRVAQAVVKSPSLEVYLAAVESLIGDYTESIARSRRVLARDPKNLVALNNMAYLLALHEKKPDQGLTLIREAIDVAGPVPTLLDTEGLILTVAGRGSEAVEKLREAVIDEPTAMTHFHLAHAYLVAGELLSARAELAIARSLNLAAKDFHPLERASVAEVSAKIDGR